MSKVASSTIGCLGCNGVNLYHCVGDGRGFFVEVGVNDGQEQPIVLRSFVRSVPLEDYSHWVRLPELRI